MKRKSCLPSARGITVHKRHGSAQQKREVRHIKLLSSVLNWNSGLLSGPWLCFCVLNCNCWWLQCTFTKVCLNLCEYKFSTDSAQLVFWMQHLKHFFFFIWIYISKCYCDISSLQRLYQECAAADAQRSRSADAVSSERAGFTSSTPVDCATTVFKLRFVCARHNHMAAMKLASCWEFSRAWS